MPACLALLASLSLLAYAADVSLKAQGPDHVIVTPHYQAVVGADGCLSSLRLNGQELLMSAPSFPRGLYMFQGGILRLPTVEQPADNVLTARSDKASLRYEFGPDRINISMTNLTDAGMEFVGVLELCVTAVRGERRGFMRTPVERGWQEATWFAGKARLRISGSSRVWGPWAGNHQVWTTGLGPKETKTLTLQVGISTEEELAQAAEAAARVPPVPKDPVGAMWDLGVLSKAPAVSPAAGFEAEGVKAIFYQGPPYEGEATRVFAWLGLPRLAPGQKAPGMVLVHGGGGTAFAEWVRLWTSRGYAAIAMDTCGCVPKGTYGNWHRDEHGGPPGWGGFDQIDEPREDQWTYHAVAAAILASSLLRSLPEVDPDRIGLTGISWGGYLACILAGADPRLRLVVPVYGCGFTLDMSFAGAVRGLGKERGDRWMRWWDPSVYLPAAPMPMLWVTGSNDFAYTFNALQKSYRLPKGPRTLCIRLRMPHGHGGPGENPEEIHAFADSILKGGDSLPRITGQGRDGKHVWATFESTVPVVSAELNITKDLGNWPDRKWDALPAKVEAGKVTAELPDGVTVYYLNLYDRRSLCVSTEHEEVPR